MPRPIHTGKRKMPELGPYLYSTGQKKASEKSGAIAL
jgi:hypothetical protein